MAQEIRARYPRAQLTRSGELTLIRLGERYIALEQTGDGLTLHFSCLGAPKLPPAAARGAGAGGPGDHRPPAAPLPMGAIRQAVDHCFSPLQSRPPDPPALAGIVFGAIAIDKVVCGPYYLSKLIN